ncbi:hypothetical protein [Cypionkella sp.]|uniref:hypothetical protein n=1 Tax=Cypionkella sp. TaxID=2811411 RepID=UPI002620DC14|nr:hypothetical protein [Cypionkella sp.]MDB5666058.1 hypothetical protein [Cypionkella sp.]
MRKIVALIAATMAAPAFAQDAPVADRAAFVALVEARDCTMTETEAATVLPPLGFTKEVTIGIVEGLVNEGLASVTDAGVLTLKTETCI